jgi:O-antigen/teichoic acid export membrane protein
MSRVQSLQAVLPRATAALLPLANIAMRGAGLAGRFALTMYLARYMDLADVGSFGLIAGAAGLLPGLIGCGMNYFVSREIVGADSLRAGALLRDRLLVTIAMLLLAVVIASAFGSSTFLGSGGHEILLLGILAGECIAFDIHMSLIALRKPVAANFLLFVRSASWIFPVVVLGVLVPSLRTLEFVLRSWALGVALNFLCLGLVLRDWPARAILRSAIDHRWLLKTIRHGWLIYLSDLGMAGQLYLDRYVVNELLGLKLTGVYTLYWSMANAVHVLVTVAVVQVALPDLVETYRGGIERDWQRAFFRTLGKMLAIALPLAIACAVVVTAVLPRLGLKQFSAAPGLLFLMLGGVMVRLVADTLSYGLYSRNMDRGFALLNIAGIVVSLTLSVAFVSKFGLIGIGLSMIASPLFLLVARGVLLGRAPRRAAPSRVSD